MSKHTYSAVELSYYAKVNAKLPETVEFEMQPYGMVVLTGLKLEENQQVKGFGFPGRPLFQQSERRQLRHRRSRFSRHSRWEATVGLLDDAILAVYLRVQSDFAESSFVLAEVLLQQL